MDHDPASERELVDRARRGDPDAWEQLYRRVYPRLVAYARRRLAAPEQAEEAVSETMARAMEMIDRYRPTPSGIDAWCFGIARNVVLEQYRAGARQRPVDPSGPVLASGPAPATTARTASDPESVVLAREQREELARAFDRLSEDDQDLLELRVLGGLDAEQVGRLTGRRAGAVRQAQSRALTRLRGHLQGPAR